MKINPESPENKKERLREETERSKDGLRSRITRAERLRALVNAPGWQKDMLPYLANLIIELGTGGLWNPNNKAEIDAVALGCAFNGGRVEQINDVTRKLDIWIEQGVDASSELARLNKLEGGNKK